MRYAYQNGKDSGHVDAYTAIGAASKVMGRKATHVCGDVYDSATYQAQYRDNDDYDQCILKVDPKPGLTPVGRVAVGVLVALGIFAASGTGVAVYDGDLFRQLAMNVLGPNYPVVRVAQP